MPGVAFGLWLWLFAALVVGALQPSAPTPPTLVLIDPFTSYLSGLCREYCSEHSIQVIEAVSPFTANVLLKSSGNALPTSLRAPDVGSEAEWAESKGLPVPSAADEDEDAGDGEGAGAVNANVLVISESDAGVATAERLQVFLNAPGNGVSPQLRDKHEQNVRASRRGLDTVRQVLASSWPQAEAFLRALWGLEDGAADLPEGDARCCVVKPCRGVASDGVHLCGSLREARARFEELLGSPRYGELARLQESVLVQEFADGPEFAVDTVTAGGETKVVALWRYAKLPCNGAPFVYQCSELESDPSTPECAAVMDYAVRVVEAQGLRFGPTHTEVRLSPRGPLLMEINARWHAQHFPPLTQTCLGYDALTATMDAFFRPSVFSALPPRPQPFRGRALILHLISRKQGVVRRVHGDAIRELRSCLHLSVDHEPGSRLQRTVNIRTDCGYCLLQHADAAVVEADYRHVCDRLQQELFELEGEEGAEDGEARGDGGGQGEGQHARRSSRARGKRRSAAAGLTPAPPPDAHFSDGHVSGEGEGEGEGDDDGGRKRGRGLLARLRRAALGSVVTLAMGYAASLVAVLLLPEA